MRPWLRRGAAAAALAGERSDLWPSATLAHLAYLGWLPLLLGVAPPQAVDLAHIGVELWTAGSFPANIVAVAVVAVAAFLLLALAAAVAEVMLHGSLVPPVQATGGAVLSVLAVMVLAATPAVLALGWLVIGVAQHGPTVYGEPGSATTLLLRLAARLTPQLLVLAGAVLVAQVVGGVALRQVLADDDRSIGRALRHGVVGLTHRPGAVCLATAAWLADALLLLGSWALLAILWRPIAAMLGPGLLSNPQVVALLVGFVAIWLLLLTAGGVAHALFSAWWVLEGSDHEPGTDARAADRARPAPDGGAGAGSDHRLRA
ncbi:MAG TPA: hypothetical protein VHK63_08380 [Candidatus Limnocylindria bacterium]|nr:hypothetical protein [Candidatus Limnocylindria bacterium]